MSQITPVVDTVKSLLKSKGITYSLLAEQLGMSEANVKRMFAQKRFTLSRLEQICDVLLISMTDLFAMTQRESTKLSQLTSEQEDQSLPLKDRQHIGMLLAMRPWEPSLFEKMRRPAE